MPMVVLHAWKQGSFYKLEFSGNNTGVASCMQEIVSGKEDSGLISKIKWRLTQDISNEGGDCVNLW